MFLDKIRNGWSLAMSSFEVLKLDPELMLFPLASGLSCLMILASFALPLIGFGDGTYMDVLLDDETTSTDILAYLLLFLFYFANYFVILFFNSALVACAIIRFKGGDPTIKDGIRAAVSSVVYIVMWALVAATVGVILKVVESRSENIGKFIAGLLGTAWSMLTFFVVPVLVIEHKSPWEAFNRSKNIMFKTWGETFASSFSIGIINFLFMIVAAIPLFLGFMMMGAGGSTPGYVLIALGIIMMIGGVLCTSALESILLAGLYIYSKEGIVPDCYDESTFSSAFQN